MTKKWKLQSLETPAAVSYHHLLVFKASRKVNDLNVAYKIYLVAEKNHKRFGSVQIFETRSRRVRLLSGIVLCKLEVESSTRIDEFVE
jgi:hypothetical protein